MSILIWTVLLFRFLLKVFKKDCRPQQEHEKLPSMQRGTEVQWVNATYPSLKP